MILVILYHSLMFWGGEWFAYPPKNPSIILKGIAAFTCLDELANKVKWDNKLFKKLSLCAMPMYLFHEQIIYFAIYWLDGINPYLHASIIFVIALVVSYAISVLLLRFKTTRFLVGEK